MNTLAGWLTNKVKGYTAPRGQTKVERSCFFSAFQKRDTSDGDGGGAGKRTFTHECRALDSNILK